MARKGDSDVGLMRHRLVWQTPPTTVDVMNEAPLEGWVTVKTLWARVEPLGGGEAFNANQPKATSTHRITMRGGQPILATHRFLFEATGRVFNVDSINRRDERNQYIDILATEQTPP